MTQEAKDSAAAEDLISTGEDTLGSSISLSLGESSVRLREKSKPVIEEPLAGRSRVEEKKWWLKRPDTRLGNSTSGRNPVPANEQKRTSSPDISSSMKEFLEKEKFCKAQHKSEGEEKRDKDDTLCDILASAAFDKYPSDFENATDEDIGSFLEEMSKIAGALSPSSAPERTKSGEDSSKNPTEEEKSVEELLEEAERLVRENVGLSKSASRSDTLVPEDAQNLPENSRVQRLEEDIFHLIEQEVHRESEKIRKSPKNEKKRRETSPSFEILYENVNTLKPPRLATLETQKKRFEDHKVEVSSSSDLDDPIERHSKSEDAAKIDEVARDKENLQKEITDVDKDFFDDLLRRSKEKIEGGMSGSSSFGQEDFSHFLRILQGQDHRKEAETRGAPKSAAREISVEGNVGFPEKEITAILEKEFPASLSANNNNENEKNAHEFGESDASVESDVKREKSRISGGEFGKKRSQSQEKIESGNREKISRSASVDEAKNSQRKSSKSEEAKKVVNSRSELYTVGLTPRLELFADAIPKLIAEKSNENLRQEARNESEEKSLRDEKILGEANEEKQRENREQSSMKSNEEKQQKDREKSSTKSNEENREKSSTKPNEENREKSSTKPNEENHQKHREKSSPKSTETSDSPSKTTKNEENREIVDKSSSRSPRPKTEIARLNPSKSYDQLAKSASNLRASLDDVRTIKSADFPRRSSQNPPKSSTTSRIPPKSSAKIPTSKQTPKMKPSLKPSISKFPPTQKTPTRPEIPSKYSPAGGDCAKNLTRSDLEFLCRDERRKNAQLKRQLDSEAAIYKQQMQNMRTSFEEELFALKKQNIVLKAKIDELTLHERRAEPPTRSTQSETRIRLLEKELEKQEVVINTYERENKRLMTEIKSLKEETRATESKRKIALDASESQKLNDLIKDLREEKLKLDLEIADLRLKNSEALAKIEDSLQQESLLKEELEMFKDQLKTKNDFINARLQSMTTAELESRRKTEDLRIELSSKTEQLKCLRIEYENLQQAVQPLQKELLELRAKDEATAEKLQTAKNHVEREKQLTLKLKDQVILDNKKILDLNRQVREMERILKRKNPDSVSALILTAKSDHERVNLEKVKLLEDRVAQLEGETRAKEEIAQEKLADLQKKFGEMREKYGSQVEELEAKLAEATRRERRILSDVSTQTAAKILENKATEAGNSRERSASVQSEKEKTVPKIGPKSQNPKEDSHLIATIRGLKLELANKEKNCARMSKDFQELQKTNRRLQKEREKLLNDRRTFRGAEGEKNGRPASAGSDPKIAGGKNIEGNDQNSNVYQNGHLANGNAQRLAGSQGRLYDPLQYSEASETASAKKLANENEILKEELGKINKDFMTLKNKRLHDLNLLQEEHEREMATLVKEYSVKFGDSKVVKLQGQINTQVAIITHLKQQIEKLRDYKEQVVVLKVEREHLENKVKILNEKVKYLSTPGTEQLQLLQDKITILQQRHESREMTLQSLVRDLLRNRTQCRDCKGEKGKSTKQLCYFRQELDNILGMLQEISNVH